MRAINAPLSARYGACLVLRDASHRSQACAGCVNLPALRRSSGRGRGTTTRLKGVNALMASRCTASGTRALPPVERSRSHESVGQRVEDAAAERAEDTAAERSAARHRQERERQERQRIERRRCRLRARAGGVADLRARLRPRRRPDVAPVLAKELPSPAIGTPSCTNVCNVCSGMPRERAAAANCCS